jgi:serine/threonine protein kinase
MLRFLEKLGLKRTKSSEADDLSSIRQTMASEVIWAWPENEPIRVERALELYPELAECNRAMLEIAIEEFADRRNSTDEVSATSFADQFPEFRTELMDALVVDQFLSEHAEWFDDVLLTNHSPEEIEWPKLGEQIAGFRLVDNLGSGGFSRVYLAEDLAYPERLVAVKFCSNETHEAKALANLNHNAIGVVYSVTPVPERNLSAICMAFKTRTTLHRIIRKVWSNKRPSKARLVWNEVSTANKLDTTKAPEWSKQSLVAWVTDVAAELARGLSASHELDIIHCDMKPSNIMIDRDGRPTLVDFNVAFQKDAKTSPGNIGGTLPYMSPEQIRAFAGQGYSDVGPLTDVYGLGATMYELLTGRMPFGPAPTAEDGIRSLLEMRKIKPRPIRDFNSSVDPDLERLVLSCLAYEMSARPVSAKVVADELDFIRKRAIVQGMPTEWWLNRRSVATAAAAVILLAVALAPSGNERDGGLGDQEANAQLPHPHAIAVDLVEQGYKALAQGDADDAIELFEQAKVHDPRHEGGQLGYIRALIATRDFQDASDELSRLNQGKSIAELEALRAYCTGLLKKYELAISISQNVQARGFATPEVVSNHSFFLSGTLKSTHKQGAVQFAKQALQQMGRPSKANLVMALALMRSDPLGRTVDPQLVKQLIADTPDSAEKYNLMALSNLLFSFKQEQQENNAGYNEYQTLALDSFVKATELGLSESWYGTLRASGLDEIQQERVKAEGWYANAPEKAVERRDPLAYLLDPIARTRFDGSLERNLKDVDKAPRAVNVAAVPKHQLAKAN